jgi:hypothetical protein
MLVFALLLNACSTKLTRRSRSTTLKVISLLLLSILAILAFIRVHMFCLCSSLNSLRRQG